MRATVKLRAASLFGALAALACAAQSQAATVIQSTTFSRVPHSAVLADKQPGDRSDVLLDKTGALQTSLHFDGFDQSLGTLTGVRLQLTSLHDYDAGISIIGSGSVLLKEAFYHSAVQLGGQDVGGLVTTHALDGLVFCHTASFACLAEDTGQQSFNFDVAMADLSPFQTPGGVDLTLWSQISLLAYIYDLSGNSLLTAAGGLHWDGDLSLAYTYDTAIVPPPTAVPEPATWAMLIAGFGLTGAALRRRRGAVLAA
jgi:hypothetical protein